MCSGFTTDSGVIRRLILGKSGPSLFQQLLTVSRSRALGHFPPPGSICQPVWSSQVLCSQPYCWEFTVASFLSCPEESVYSRCPGPLVLTILLLSFPPCSLRLLCRGFDWDVSTGVVQPLVTCCLHFPCISVVVSICCQKQFLVEAENCICREQVWVIVSFSDLEFEILNLNW